MRRPIYLDPVAREGKRTACSLAFFFPQKLALDAAGMHPQIELLFHRFRELSETQRRVRGPLLGHELHHLRSELVAASRTALPGQQSGQATLLESEFGLIERRPRETKLLGRLGNRPLVHTDLSQHLVFYLDQVVGIEELAVLKQRMGHILRAGVEGSVLPQGSLFVGVVVFHSRHSRLGPVSVLGRL
jgi:hypothetical protein